MIMKTLRRLPGLGLAGLLFLSSCAMRQEAFLGKDGSGSVKFRIQLQPFFMDYIRDMAEVAADNGANSTVVKDRIFDTDKIRQDLETRPGVKVTRLASPKPDALEGEFTFRDVEAVFRGEKQLAQAGVISFTRKGNVKTLQLHLDRKNFGQVAALTPLLQNPIFESLGPQENEGVSEQDYLDMMQFAMGDPAPKGIRDSLIELKVTVQGKVASVMGGTLQKDGSVLFQIPLIRVLLLDRPLDYALSFE